MSRGERHGPWLIVLLAVAVVLAVGLAGYAVTSPNNSTPDGTKPIYTPRPTDTAVPAPAIKTTVADAMKRLEDQPQRPWRLGVLGDSTGVNAIDGWVELLIVWASKKYDRPVRVSWWSVDRNQRITWTQNDSGKNAPIIVWSGSAGGKDFAYSKSRLNDLILPREQKKIDLLFINHGHNLSRSTDYYYEGKPFIAGLMEKWPNTAIMLMAQNPERIGTPHAPIGEKVIGQVKNFAEWSGLPYVDIHQLFVDESRGNTDSLLDKTDFHPNKRGYVLWFEAVRDTLLAS